MSQNKAALIAAFLCSLFFIMPWAAVVSDPFYVHTVSIGASLLLVIVCYFLSARMWSVAIQVIECLCIIYQAEVVTNWDNPVDKFYIFHDEFMLCAFILELIFIIGSLDKITAVIHGIADTFRRAFLAIVSLYPVQHFGLDVSDYKENHWC